MHSKEALEDTHTKKPLGSCSITVHPPNWIHHWTCHLHLIKLTESIRFCYNISAGSPHENLLPCHGEMDLVVMGDICFRDSPQLSVMFTRKPNTRMACYISKPVGRAPTPLGVLLEVEQRWPHAWWWNGMNDLLPSLQCVKKKDVKK